MTESIGVSDTAAIDLDVPKDIVSKAHAQKCCVVIIALLKTKPSKPDAKRKKADNLKSELKCVRKLGLKEDIVLPKSLHEATIKQISALS